MNPSTVSTIKLTAISLVVFAGYLYINELPTIQAIKSTLSSSPTHTYTPIIGMSTRAVLDGSWGEPLRISTTLTDNSRSEYWYYRDGRSLYFRDDRIVSISY